LFAPDDDVGLAPVLVDDAEGKDKEGEMVVVLPPDWLDVIDAGTEKEALELVNGPWNCDAGGDEDVMEGASLMFSSVF
jgi:hypothetical protein